MSIARGAATAGLRAIDPLDPRTWEFSGFSQNGEDGIIDHLLTGLTTKTAILSKWDVPMGWKTIQAGLLSSAALAV